MGLFRTGRFNELQGLILAQIADDTEDADASWGTEFVSLEEAGLEEAASQPVFGIQGQEALRGGVVEQIDWFSDGEDSRYEAN